jgi:hypothetical protein
MVRIWPILASAMKRASRYSAEVLYAALYPCKRIIIGSSCSHEQVPGFTVGIIGKRVYPPRGFFQRLWIGLDTRTRLLAT